MAANTLGTITQAEESSGRSQGKLKDSLKVTELSPCSEFQKEKTESGFCHVPGIDVTLEKHHRNQLLPNYHHVTRRKLTFINLHRLHHHDHSSSH